MTDQHVPALIIGLAGLALIVFGLIWYFLAPARRPVVERVRADVRERMRPVLVVPPSPEVVAYAARSVDPYDEFSHLYGPAELRRREVRLAHEAELAARERHTHRIAVLESGADLDEPEGIAPTGEGATVDWSPSATAAAVGQSDDMTDEAIERAKQIEAEVRAEVIARLDAADTPPAIEVKGIDDFTDTEIDDARWGEEFRRLDAALDVAKWTMMTNLAATCGPAFAVDVLAAQHRAQVRERAAIRTAAAWATGEGKLVDAGPRKRPPTPAQARRTRKKDNRNRARAERILVEVGA
jgi:hypothetical protein